MIWPYSIEPLKVISREIESHNGFSYTDFVGDVQSVKIPESSIRYIWQIEMSGKVKFVLKGKEAYVDEDSPKDLYAQYENNERQIDLLTSNPMQTVIEHSNLKSQSQNVDASDAAFYEIIFRSETNIWYEDTEIGLANRKRLQNLFRNIHDNFEVVSTTFLGSAEGFEYLT